MATYRKLLAEFRRKLGLPDITDDSYDGLRRADVNVHPLGPKSRKPHATVGSKPLTQAMEAGE